ncbi:hypothetical protein ABPG75_003109 [Micractinium tetrahymenae]
MRPNSQLRTSGRLPNVFYRAPSMHELRQMAQFEALPPVEAIAVAGPASHRYVRQDDPLWGQLHEGVLTTGWVRGALGLYERAAAKKVGIPSGRVGHSELLQAYCHLHQAAGTAASQAAVDGAVAAAAAAHNAAAVLAYNASKAEAARAAAGATAGSAAGPQGVAQGQAGEPGAAGPAQVTAAALAESASAGKSRHARKRLRKKQEQAATAAAATALAQQPGLPPVGGVSEEQKLRKARALSSLGLSSICCSWGSAQEAAALVQVAAAFPLSQLAEVGLCRLQQELLPPDWGFGSGSLPPIGASPDALIRHCLPCPTTGGVQAEGGIANGAASASLGAVAGQAGSQAACTAQQAVGPWDIDGLLARLQLAGKGDGLARGSSNGSSIGSSTGSSPSGGGGASSMANGGSTTSMANDGSGGGYLIEVVEVKNTCPFGHSRRGGKLRTSEFAVADKGPRQAVPPEWVPQLQLHMLCAGTPSGLLVSRSATKGTRIFRMHRDDQLLRMMLQVLSRLWVQHVLPGQPPSADVFASWHVHHDMLRRIGEVARGAQLVLVLEEGQHMPEGDRRWFLD